MSNPDGTPIWFELLAADADAAQAFYAEVAGWTIAPSGMAGVGDYRILTAPDGVAVGGLMALPDGAPFPPGWLLYYGVADVDASVARVRELGGSVHMEPSDIPGVGRMALVADPQRVAFYVMRGDSAEPSKAFLQGPGSIGHGVWTELATPDPDAAFAFYGALFGWTKAGGMPMGEMGDYAFIGTGEAAAGGADGGAGAGSPGAVMSSAKTGAPARWNMYFHVPDLDAALATAKDLGGSVIQGPDPIPGGDYSSNIADPQGGSVGLVGPSKGK